MDELAFLADKWAFALLFVVLVVLVVLSIAKAMNDDDNW